GDRERKDGQRARTGATGGVGLDAGGRGRRQVPARPGPARVDARVATHAVAGTLGSLRGPGYHARGTARWPSGYAEACKASYSGSNPLGASQPASSASAASLLPRDARTP